MFFLMCFIQWCKKFLLKDWNAKSKLYDKHKKQILEKGFLHVTN